ncbi:hypothetical protein H4R18_000023 [Coemansia javaensis]|uniref:GAF domain-containing protein n=1 Tax=Coemansia javaensis TaxID=2761396 RepID=A0A9W8LM91_9FUNG|nr:hypothetical protein H4R18_000023 [Coemansia javaensis]
MSAFVPPCFGAEPNAKAALYRGLAAECAALLQGQRNAVTNMANAAALVFHALREAEAEAGARAGKPVNWAGFYTRDGSRADVLVLGPFQGRPACAEIAFGRGVCGAAAAGARSVVVADVGAFPGHIACDAASKSEIVVPLLAADGRVLGVLDVDAAAEDAFDDYDRIGLEAIARMVVEASDF